jgi:hypothetical protein
MTCSSRLNTSDALLDFVEQQHAVRMLGDRFGEQATLVEPDVTRRRADQARHRVPLHVLGHVEANEFDAERDRQLARDFGLADAGGSANRKLPTGLRWSPRPGPRHLDGGAERLDRLVLPVDDELEIALQVAEHFLVEVETLFAGMRAMRATTSFDVSHLDRGVAFVRRFQSQSRAGLIDHVDGLVGHVPLR